MKVFGEGRSKIYGSLKHAGKATLEVLSLPVEPLMKDEDILYIVQTVKKLFQMKIV
jgi:dTDP-4-amino-4,6-dideoxygalactose transaminase